MDAVPPSSAADDVDTTLTRAHRAEWAAVVASTARLTGDLDLAEECTQEAFARAVEVWPARGIPDRPGAWLTTVAANRARDELRRRTALRRRLPLLVREDPPDDDASWLADDRLRLVFTCCHPALSREAQVGLTMRLVCGVPAGDVAAVLLVSEPAMAARLTRAKRKIAVARIPFRVPDAAELPERIDVVCDVLYLVFTVGHAPPSGEAPVRAELVDEAIALTRMVHGLLPRSRAVTGLLALMLLTDARRGTRDALLPDQDRSRWDQGELDEGRELVRRCLRRDHLGPYQLQAAMQAVHSEPAGTDWRQIVILYDQLMSIAPSPVVELNRAVAVAELEGPAAGLALVDGLPLERFYLFHAVRADLLKRLDRPSDAAAAYDEALALTPNDAERAFLQRSRDALSPGAPPAPPAR